MSYLQIDPDAVGLLAGGLRRGVDGLEHTARAVETALVVADLLDDTPSCLRRRIDRWLDTADTLDRRADEVWSFELELRGSDGGLRLAIEHDDGRLELTVGPSLVDTVESWIGRITSIRPRPANPTPDLDQLGEGLDEFVDLVQGAAEIGARGHELIGEGVLELGRRHWDDLGRAADFAGSAADFVGDAVTSAWEQQPVDPFGDWGIFGPNSPLAPVGDARRILPVLARQNPESLEFYAREFFDDPRDSVARAAGLWLRPDTSVCVGGGLYLGYGGGANVCLVNANGEGGLTFTTEHGDGLASWVGVDFSRLVGVEGLDDLDGEGTLSAVALGPFGLSRLLSGSGDPFWQASGSVSAGGGQRDAETNTRIHRAPEHGPFDRDDEEDDD